MKRNMRLPHDETDEHKRYTMPDPDALKELYLEARRAYYLPELNEHGTPTDEQIGALLSLADGYLGLTTYELGQEACCRKLRDIWRARRDRRKPEQPCHADVLLAIASNEQEK